VVLLRIYKATLKSLPVIATRDVTNFKFEFDKIQTFSTDSKFDKCFKCLVECEFKENPCFTTDFIQYAQTARQHSQTFSQIQPITHTTVIECAT